MNAPYTCLRCRAGLYLRVTPLPKLSRRTYISLSDLGPPKSPEAPSLTKDDPPKTTGPRGVQKSRYSRTELSTDLLELFESGKRQKPVVSTTSNGGKSAKKSRTSPDTQHRSSDQLELFGPPKPQEPLTSNDNGPTGSLPNPSLTQKPGLGANDSEIDQLEKSYVAKEPLSRIWKLFMSLIESRNDSLSEIEQVRLRKSPVANFLFQAMTERRLKNPESSTPALAELSKIYKEQGLMEARLLHSMFRRGLTTVVERIWGLEQDYTRAAFALEEILRVWQSTIQGFVAPTSFTEQPMDIWRGIPSVEHIQNGNGTLPIDFRIRFAHFMPGTYTHENGTVFASDAATTYLCYHILKQAGCLTEGLATEMKPLLLALAHMLNGSEYDREIMPGKMKQSPDVFSQMRSAWLCLFKELRDELFTAGMEPGPFTNRPALVQTDLGSIRPRDRKISQAFSDLRKAIKEGDLKFLDKLWKRHLVAPVNEKNEKDNSMIYAEFLWAFVKLDQVDKALQVWNSMKEHGIKPGTSHWTAMMEACRKHKDLESLHEIWSQVQASGLAIQNTEWSAYIRTLLHCKQWRLATKVITEMGEAWDSRASQRLSALDEVELRPSIIPINAAVSGLININRLKPAEAVLQWALERNIAPTIETFNMWLRPAVRASDQSRINWIIAEMRARSCFPDVITITILLDGVFRNADSSFGSSSQEEQQSAVATVFKEMEAAGMAATPHTYAMLLYSMLSRQPNLPAARAVLAHMSEQNVKTSPHICSILVTHYFASSPPDLEAIEALWRRMELERTPADHVFFDRLIEGYSRIGETEKMLRFLRLTRTKGKAPGWIALTAALRALMAKEDWDVTAELINDVESEKGLVRPGVTGWQGEDEWTQLVAELRRNGLVERRVDHRSPLPGIGERV